MYNGTTDRVTPSHSERAGALTQVPANGSAVAVTYGVHRCEGQAGVQHDPAGLHLINGPALAR
jgi:hypothetical protein